MQSRKFRFVICLMNKFSLWLWTSAKENVVAHTMHTENLNEEYFVGVKLSCCTPPQKFESYFLHMEISIRPHVFFQFKAIVCMRINLIRLSKHPLIITKTWNFTKNKRYHSLKLKMEFTDHVTVSFTIIYCKGLNLSSKQTLPQPGAKNRPYHRLCHRLLHCRF